jgi:hypothetical protein
MSSALLLDSCCIFRSFRSFFSACFLCFLTSLIVWCSSAVYRAYLVPVVLAFVIFVCGLPIALMALLWKGHAAVFEVIQEQQRKERAANGSDVKGISGVREMQPIPSDISLARNPLANAPVAVEDVDIMEQSSSSVSSLPTLSSSSPSPLRLRLLLPLLVPFRPSAWYWPAVLLLRRVVFVAINAAMSSSGAEQYFSYQLLHLASLVTHSYVQPFASPLLHRAEYASLLVR